MALLHLVVAFFYWLSVPYYLSLAICYLLYVICYLLSEAFYMKLAITCRNLFPFARCCTSRNFYSLVPCNHVGTLIWSLSNSTKAQGTLRNLPGSPNGPQNGPREANIRRPLVKKGPGRVPSWPKLINFFR